MYKFVSIGVSKGTKLFSFDGYYMLHGTTGTITGDLLSKMFYVTGRYKDDKLINFKMIPVEKNGYCVDNPPPVSRGYESVKTSNFLGLYPEIEKEINTAMIVTILKHGK